MAFTNITHDDVKNVQRWSRITYTEALKSTHLFKKFLGLGKKVNGQPRSSKKAIIQYFRDLEKGAGDTIRYDLLMQMTQDPITGDNRAKGQGEPLTYHQDSLIVEQMRFPHEFRRMSQQRTLHDLEQDAMENIADKAAETLESYMFRYLCGDTSINFAGNQGTAPTNQVFAGGKSSESALTSSDVLSLDDLAYAAEKARMSSPSIRPVRIEGGEYYVAVLHPYCATDIKLSAYSSSNISWPEIQQYANVRGLKNPIFTGALGVYNGIILFESHHIFSPSTNIRRNLLLGAQAGAFALANPYDKIDRKTFGDNNFMSWAYSTDDYGNEKGVCGGMVCGFKKCTFNSQDYGVVTISAYGAAHA